MLLLATRCRILSNYYFSRSSRLWDSIEKKEQSAKQYKIFFEFFEFKLRDINPKSLMLLTSGISFYQVEKRSISKVVGTVRLERETLNEYILKLPVGIWKRQCTESTLYCLKWSEFNLLVISLWNCAKQQQFPTFSPLWDLIKNLESEWIWKATDSTLKS